MVPTIKGSSPTEPSEARRGKNMNDKNTAQLLKLIDKLIALVGTNTDNINRLAQEIAELKAKK